MSVSAFVNALSTLRTGEAPPPETPAGSLPLGMRKVGAREMSQPRQQSAGGGGGRTSGDDLGAFADAVAELESGGSYEAVGPPTKLGRARGKYQIMDANWEAWAAEAGVPGASWRDPQAQERVARHKFTQYKRQFGRWDAVAVAWFAGPGAARKYVQNPASVESRSDVLGTNVRQYVDRVMGTFNDVRQTGGRHPAVAETRRVEQREQSATKHAPQGGVWNAESVGAAAQHIADTFGLQITSHKRSKEHNERVGGAKKSDHLWGGGVDFSGPPEKMRQLVDWAEQFTGPEGPFRITLHPWNDPDGHDDHVHISWHRNNSTPFTLENLGGELTPRSFAPSPHVKDHVAESGGRTQRVLGAFHRVIGGDSISGGIGQLSADIAQPQQNVTEEVG